MILSRILKRKRIEAGALSLASTELKFKLDKKTKNPLSLQLYKTKEIHSLVEEFMLLANVSVAKRTLEIFPRYAILRRHPTPQPDNFLPLKRAAKCAGFKITTGTSKELADSLDRCEAPNEPFFNKMMRIMATRCMTQAVYFSSGDFGPKEYGHYGLASAVYTHFTSPIRRYADVIVHRLLAKSIAVEGASDELFNMIQDKGCEKVREISEGINHRHHNAQLISRASNQLYTLIYFRDKHVFEDALVIAVKNNGIRVIIEKYGLEGAITLYSEPKEGEPPTKNPFVYHEENMTLVSPDKKYAIFDKVKVQIYVQKSHMRREWLVIDLAEREKKKNSDGTFKFKIDLEEQDNEKNMVNQNGKHHINGQETPIEAKQRAAKRQKIIGTMAVMT